MCVGGGAFIIAGDYFLCLILFSSATLQILEMVFRNLRNEDVSSWFVVFFKVFVSRAPTKSSASDLTSERIRAVSLQLGPRLLCRVALDLVFGFFFLCLLSVTTVVINLPSFPPVAMPPSSKYCRIACT